MQFFKELWTYIILSWTVFWSKKDLSFTTWYYPGAAICRKTTNTWREEVKCDLPGCANLSVHHDPDVRTIYIGIRVGRFTFYYGKIEILPEDARSETLIRTYLGNGVGNFVFAGQGGRFSHVQLEGSAQLKEPHADFAPSEIQKAGHYN